jgi:hypothetical protein
MAKSVFLSLATKVQEFPVGTAEGLFRFSVENEAGSELSFVETAATGATFPGIPDGNFVAKVSKNGVSVSQAFSVVPDFVSFSVPDVLTVTFP